VTAKAPRGSGWRRALWRALLLLAALTVAPVIVLRWVPPPTSAVMLAHRVERLLGHEAGPPLRYRWTGWSAIPVAVRLAVVAAEDQKFPQHWGFDFGSIADAVEDSSARGRLRGASTITQQAARNLFLWQGRSWVRKGLEAYFTVLLEACWPKRRILEVYLNIAEFGPGIYGVGAASQTFFAKRPTALAAGEAALLAAVLPNPGRLSVRSPSSYVRERAAWIQEQVALLGGPAYLKGL
jgi:monofunctional biosynthetic peptidoglycan transglycosylase